MIMENTHSLPASTDKELEAVLAEFDSKFKDKFTLLGVELEGITKPLKEFITQAYLAGKDSGRKE